MAVQEQGKDSLRVPWQQNVVKIWSRHVETLAKLSSNRFGLKARMQMSLTWMIPISIPQMLGRFKMVALARAGSAWVKRGGVDP